MGSSPSGGKNTFTKIQKSYQDLNIYPLLIKLNIGLTSDHPMYVIILKHKYESYLTNFVNDFDVFI